MSPGSGCTLAECSSGTLVNICVKPHEMVYLWWLLCLRSNLEHKLHFSKANLGQKRRRIHWRACSNADLFFVGLKQENKNAKRTQHATPSKPPSTTFTLRKKKWDMKNLLLQKGFRTYWARRGDIIKWLLLKVVYYDFCNILHDATPHLWNYAADNVPGTELR